MQNNHAAALTPAMDELWSAFSKSGLPVHSLLADCGGQKIQEKYWQKELVQ